MTAIASHRGGAYLWPENSRIAFENTARLAVEQVEFDIHPSSDGRLVVIHDATLDRTTDGTGPVAARDWTTLSQLVLKNTGDGRPLLLEEVIEIFAPTQLALRIEFKAGADYRPYPGLPARLFDILRQTAMIDRAIVTSFHLPTLAEAVQCGPAQEFIWLVAPDVYRHIGAMEDVAALAQRRSIRSLSVPITLLDDTNIAVARRVGVSIGAWGCHTEDTIRRAFTLGVDVFTTDRPDLAIAVRRSSHE